MGIRIRDDIFVYFTAMPDTMKEMVLPCNDGYTVYINNQLPIEVQRKSFLHALGHIERGDCENECRTVAEMEGDDPVLFLGKKNKKKAAAKAPAPKQAPTPTTKVLFQQEFDQSKSFRGHKRFNVSYYGYKPAEEGVLQFRNANVDMDNAKILLRKVRVDGKYTFLYVIVDGFFLGSVSSMYCNEEQRDFLKNKLYKGLVDSAHVRVEFEPVIEKDEMGKIVTVQREKIYLFLKAAE